MCEITARGKLNDHDLTDTPVINPGDWFGRTWLIEIGGSYWPIFLVAEADTVSDAIDEFADNEKFGHHIIVDTADLGDYPEDERQYGPSGQVIDLDHLMIHGREGSECPFPCRYFGDGLAPGARGRQTADLLTNWPQLQPTDQRDWPDHDQAANRISEKVEIDPPLQQDRPPRPFFSRPPGRIRGRFAGLPVGCRSLRLRPVYCPRLDQ
jgi:hypothetical protein